LRVPLTTTRRPRRTRRCRRWRGGSARDLRRVAEHNAQDLRSLAALCLHLSELALDGIGEAPASPKA
jgi:hypothetical protein